MREKRSRSIGRLFFIKSRVGEWFRRKCEFEKWFVLRMWGGEGDHECNTLTSKQKQKQKDADFWKASPKAGPTRRMQEEINIGEIEYNKSAMCT